ncbi:MAG: SUMF1/EgtB/PvdO family nonheme iron enzyme [Gammaproteobacteria bacterium]|nr:SUMF1/EgtB/PvdO family nonheme iron enzyme [Gammaproteobacteria bacterium]
MNPVWVAPIRTAVKRSPSAARVVCVVLALGLSATLAISATGDQCHAAVAFSENADGTHSWGLTWSFANDATATARAIAECWNNGVGECTQVARFSNACVATPDGGSIGLGGVAMASSGNSSRIADVAHDASAAGDDDTETFQDCPNCPPMVVVPAGSFRMGCVSGYGDCGHDELPVHEVSFAHPFALSATEVTFAQWDDCAAGGGCDGYRPFDEGWGRGTHPVVNVSWYDAQRYATWLSGQTGAQYRLPTESEWEYAARAGTTTRYSWGEQVGENRANCGGCGAAWNNRRHSAPVGSFKPNAWGLYDMHGNVWEWVQDAYQLKYGGANDVGEDKGSEPPRVLRGGSWISSPKYLRSAYRFRYAPDGRYFIVGFRVARTLPP